MTVGLCVITRDLTDELLHKLVDLREHVDAIYVQVNGGTKPTNPLLNISYRPWTENFAEARNALLEEVTTDYWTWFDSDDTIRGAELIRPTVEYMAAEGIDIMFAPYEYKRDQNGNITELQRRERIIRTSLKGEWHGAIHETWIPEVPAIEETCQITWVHDHKEDETPSMIRNRAILEREYAKEPRDPRIAYYLGLNYGMDGHYKEAIECFLELIKTGGWDEERYRAWLQIFSCYFELGEYENALQAAQQATQELPDWPDAYLLMQQVYYHLDDHTKALEWFHTARAKKQPDTKSARSPVVTQYQPLYLAAYSYMCVGEPEKALECAMELSRLVKDYPGMEVLRPEIVRAVNESRAIENAKKLIEFNEKYEGDPKAVLDSLPASLRGDVRLTSERRRLIPGSKWPRGSVAYYCGSSYEPWGPDTLGQGMGGSEEAVVYLSRELGQVVVYNERQSEYKDGQKVIYEPWTEINPNDEFDVFIAWRDPSILREIKARKRLADIHDIIPAENVYAAIPYCDGFMFKSQFHRELYPEVPDDKCFVIGNGIKRSQFNG